jgi:hypothetical protein
MGDLMTKNDATQFLMGFILGATLNQRLVSKVGKEGLLLRKISRKGIELLLHREQGFFNALERVVREEIESSGFEGEYN